MRRVGEDGPLASLPLSECFFCFVDESVDLPTSVGRQRSLGIHGAAALGGVGSTGEVVAAGFPLTSGPPITGMATHHPSLSRRNAGPGQIQVISGVSVCRHLLPVIPQRLHIPSVHDVPVRGSPTVPFWYRSMVCQSTTTAALLGIARHTKPGETNCFISYSKQPCPRTDLGRPLGTLKWRTARGANGDAWIPSLATPHPPLPTSPTEMGSWRASGGGGEEQF